VPPDPAREHTWLTLAELRELFHIIERHIRRLVAENRIPYTKVRGWFGFNLARVEGWLDQNSDEPDRRMGRGRTA
jgi:excisionase family DNA binding protein